MLSESGSLCSFVCLFSYFFIIFSLLFLIISFIFHYFSLFFLLISFIFLYFFLLFLFPFTSLYFAFFFFLCFLNNLYYFSYCFSPFIIIIIFLFISFLSLLLLLLHLLQAFFACARSPPRSSSPRCAKIILPAYFSLWNQWKISIFLRLLSLPSRSPQGRGASAPLPCVEFEGGERNLRSPRLLLLSFCRLCLCFLLPHLSFVPNWPRLEPPRLIDEPSRSVGWARRRLKQGDMREMGEKKPPTLLDCCLLCLAWGRPACADAFERSRLWRQPARGMHLSLVSCVLFDVTAARFVLAPHNGPAG